MDNQPGNNRRKKDMNWEERLLFMGVFVIIGLCALGFNLRTMFKHDWYYSIISYLGGVAIASGVILGFFKTPNLKKVNSGICLSFLLLSSHFVLALFLTWFLPASFTNSF